jgi:hypothetical protein
VLKERINEVFSASPRRTWSCATTRSAPSTSPTSRPRAAKKLRYTEASEAEQKAAEKKAIEDRSARPPKGRECFKNACREFDAKRFDKAISQLKMALMYEPANAKYKGEAQEAEKEWDKNRPKDDFRIK